MLSLDAVRGKGWAGFLLCGSAAATLWFLGAIPVGMVHVAGGGGCLVCAWGPAVECPALAISQNVKLFLRANIV